MKRLAFCCLLFATATVRAEDPQPKTAEQILRIVRLSYALQNHKMDGVLRDDAAGLMAFAIDEATGRFTTLGAAQPDAVLRYRLAGSAMIAPLVTLGEAASQQDPQLLERFLAPAAP